MKSNGRWAGPAIVAAGLLVAGLVAVLTDAPATSASALGASAELAAQASVRRGQRGAGDVSRKVAASGGDPVARAGSLIVQCTETAFREPIANALCELTELSPGDSPSEPRRLRSGPDGTAVFVGLPCGVDWLLRVESAGLGEYEDMVTTSGPLTTVAAQLEGTAALSVLVEFTDGQVLSDVPVLLRRGTAVRTYATDAHGACRAPELPADARVDVVVSTRGYAVHEQAVDLTETRDVRVRLERATPLDVVVTIPGLGGTDGRVGVRLAIQSGDLLLHSGVHRLRARTSFPLRDVGGEDVTVNATPDGGAAIVGRALIQDRGDGSRLARVELDGFQARRCVFRDTAGAAIHGRISYRSGRVAGDLGVTYDGSAWITLPVGSQTTSPFVFWSADGMSAPVDLAAHPAGEECQIVLGLAGGSVTVAGAPAGVDVSVERYGPRAATFPRKRSDTGDWCFTVPPGTYHAVVGGVPIPQRKVVVKDGDSHARIDLDGFGRLSAVTGRGVPEALVNVWQITAGRMRRVRTVRVSASGEFRAVGLAPGRYVVGSRPESGGLVSHAFEVGVGETPSVEVLDDSQGEAVEIRVSDDGGEPFAGQNMLIGCLPSRSSPRFELTLDQQGAAHVRVDRRGPLFLGLTHGYLIASDEDSPGRYVVRVPPPGQRRGIVELPESLSGSTQLQWITPRGNALWVQELSGVDARRFRYPGGSGVQHFYVAGREGGEYLRGIAGGDGAVRVERGRAITVSAGDYAGEAVTWVLKTRAFRGRDVSALGWQRGPKALSEPEVVVRATAGFVSKFTFYSAAGAALWSTEIREDTDDRIVATR